MQVHFHPRIQSQSSQKYLSLRTALSRLSASHIHVAQIHALNQSLDLIIFQNSSPGDVIELLVAGTLVTLPTESIGRFYIQAQPLQNRTKDAGITNIVTSLYTK